MSGSPSAVFAGALSGAARPPNSVRCAAPLTQPRCKVVIQLHHWHVWLRTTYSAVPFTLLAHGSIHFGGTYVQGLVPLLHTSTFIFCLSQQSPFDRETNHYCAPMIAGDALHMPRFSHFRMAYMSEIRGVSFLYSRLFPRCEPERHLSPSRDFVQGWARSPSLWGWVGCVESPRRL